MKSSIQNLAAIVAGAFCASSLAGCKKSESGSGDGNNPGGKPSQGNNPGGKPSHEPAPFIEHGNMLDRSLSRSDLGLALFQEISKSSNQNENVWISPLSINNAMAMATMGATSGSETETELLDALNAGKKDDLANRCHAEMTFASQFDGESGNEHLAIANAIAASDVIKQDYIDLLKTKFRADALSLDLSTINSWVATKTNDKITNLLHELAADAQAVIVNAVYFKGDFETPFKTNDTFESKFTLLGGEGEKDCAMMKSKKEEFYFDHDLFQAVMKPYESGKIAALFVLPKQPGADALSSVETAVVDAFHTGTFKEDFGWPTRKQKVNLQVPRFKLNEKLSLKDHLQSEPVGVKHAFSLNAGFKEMSDISDLCIDDVIHSTTLEVTEKGTVATGATAVEENEYYVSGTDKSLSTACFGPKFCQ